MKEWVKHLMVLLGFLICTMAYFSAKMDGKELVQGDVEKWEGMYEELRQYGEEGGKSAWCSSMFSGMPAYTTSMCGYQPNALSMVEKYTFHLFGSKDAGVVICMLITMYILLMSLKLGTMTSVFGSVAYAFSSYNLIIIAAGHITKAWAMAYMPLALAGLILILKGKRKLLGTTLFTFGVCLNVCATHYQISYYLALLCLVIFVAYIVYCVKNKIEMELPKKLASLCGGVIVCLLIAAPSLYSYYEVGKYSIRGKSELTKTGEDKKNESSGLDKDYAFAWSYGKAETLSLLIPNIHGGESGGTVDSKNSNLAKELKKHGANPGKELRTYTYWGEQPFTSGPVYFGAIVCFLMVFALAYINNWKIWTLFGASVFFIFLSWGHNMSWFNDFLFHNLPFYNKFRTPSMALVVPQLVFALMAALALGAYVNDNGGKLDFAKFKRALGISAGLTGGVCLLMWIAPGMFFDFTCSGDSRMEGNMPDWYISALIEDRKDLLRGDALRSFVFIFIGAGLMFFFSKESMADKRKYVVAALAVLTLVDLWAVDKRYLNEDNYVKEGRRTGNKATAANKAILSDKTKDFRVLTLNNPFNDSHVSYYHHSIGGYNAAKLRRYQDLIEQCIEPEMRMVRNGLSNARTFADLDSVFAGAQVLNMLNMKYLIIDDNREPLTNRMRNGDAWFVNDVRYAENADAEMAMLKTIDTKSTAVVNEEFKETISGYGNIEGAEIELTESKPNIKTYRAKANEDALAIFSDVYYKDWVARIDGKEVPIARANWVLRGLVVPKGEHTIEFEFIPATFNTLHTMSRVVSYVIVLGFVAFVVMMVIRRRKADIAK